MAETPITDPPARRPRRAGVGLLLGLVVALVAIVIAVGSIGPSGLVARWRLPGREVAMAERMRDDLIALCVDGDASEGRLAAIFEPIRDGAIVSVELTREGQPHGTLRVQEVLLDVSRHNRWTAEATYRWDARTVITVGPVSGSGSGFSASALSTEDRRLVVDRWLKGLVSVEIRSGGETRYTLAPIIDEPIRALRYVWTDDDLAAEVVVALPE